MMTLTRQSRLTHLTLTRPRQNHRLDQMSSPIPSRYRRMTPRLRKRDSAAWLRPSISSTHKGSSGH